MRLLRIPRSLFYPAAIVLLAILSPANAAEMTMEERRASVVTLEQHIEQRKLRLEGIKGDIKSLDDRVEAGIEKIVSTVSGIADSETSRRRVSQLKGDVVSRLRNSIDFYDRQRNELREQLRRDQTAIPRETLESDLAIFNERIEKRVEQIERIAASFPESEDLDKYVVTRTSTSFGFGFGRRTREHEEISEAWKQNRRDTKQTESMQKRLLDGLNDSIAHLQQRNSFLTEKLDGQGVTEVERALYGSEIRQNEETIDLRHEQIRQFTERQPAQLETLDQNEAHSTELLVQDMISDLRDDFFAIFQDYTELNKERADLERLTENLAARKQWLKENDK
ncbi:MAG: hypothetical protein AAGC68_10170 [Verrucomicrobiota bacterium]